jgi:hypothetical protein
LLVGRLLIDHIRAALAQIEGDDPTLWNRDNEAQGTRHAEYRRTLYSTSSEESPCESKISCSLSSNTSMAASANASYSDCWRKLFVGNTRIAIRHECATRRKESDAKPLCHLRSRSSERAYQ